MDDCRWRRCPTGTLSHIFIMTEMCRKKKKPGWNCTLTRGKFTHGLSELCAAAHVTCRDEMRLKLLSGCLVNSLTVHWAISQKAMMRHTLCHNGCWFIITMLPRFAHFPVECFFRKSCLQDPNKYWKCFRIMSGRHWLFSHWLVHFTLQLIPLLWSHPANELQCCSAIMQCLWCH